MITHVHVIIKKLCPDEAFAAALINGDVIGKIIATLVELDYGQPEITSALSIVYIVAGIVYSSDYLLIADFLKQIIADESDHTPMSIALITELSRYPQCAKKFKALKLDKYFKKLKEDPDYVAYSKEFLKNLSVLDFC